MITKIVINDVEPFKPISTINLKKLNLIIGKNGTGKTRLFKIIDNANNNVEREARRKNYVDRFFVNEDESAKDEKDLVTELKRNAISIHDKDEIIGEIVKNEKANRYGIFKKKLPSYYYIPNIRSPTSNTARGYLGNITDLKSDLFINYFFDHDCVQFTNEIFQKIFKRELDLRKVKYSSNSKDIVSYKINGKLIDPISDGYGIIDTLGIFQVLYRAEPESTVIIDEPGANLHPSAITAVMDEIITYAESKNIQLVIITHNIIAALRFFEKINNKDQDTTVHRFEQIDHLTYIHNTDTDNITQSLKDFLGEFFNESNIKLLKDITGLYP